MDDEEEVVLAPPHRARPQRRRYPMSHQDLQTLLAPHTDPAAVLLQLDRDDSGFDLLLQASYSPSGRAQTTVKVIEKALGISAVPIGDAGGAERQRHFLAQRQAVINVITKFLDVASEPFREHLRTALQRVAGADEGFVRGVLRICKLALQTSPPLAARCLGALILNLEDVILSGRGTGFPGLVAEIEDLKELQRHGARMPTLGTGEESEGAGGGQRLRLRHRDDDMDPRQFRELSIAPCSADFDPAEDIEVRANKVRGGYASVDEYLDTQFRLLRADLLLPLRESVLAYIGNGQERPQVRGICVYNEVRIVRPICNDKGLCFRLSFDISHTRRVNWAVSQRLKYGSLLCLSADNFETYQCAVVENRDIKDLELGLVDVQFLATQDAGAAGANMAAAVAAVEDSIALLAQARELRFTMVESPAYFEAYKHVLMGLQNVTEDVFPFWRYIGECVPEAKPPRYLRDVGGGDEHIITYDMRPLVDDSYVIKDTQDDADDANGAAGGFTQDAEVARRVDVLRPDMWPNANTLALDTSQYRALQTALTREFSIIQGPPGTGKTFLGLKVLKVLLHNRRLWRANQQNQASPILLVCYTNHALDQFLEGVITFFKGNLVRVGSRSKSEALEQYNLRDIRKRARENRMVPMDIHLAKRQVRIDLKDLKVTVHREAAKLEILEREIVRESFLKDFMTDDHWRQLSGKKKIPPGRSILVWLKIAAAVDRIQAEMGARRDRFYDIVAPEGQVRQNASALVALQEHMDAVGGDGMEGVGDNQEEEEDEDNEEDDFFEVITADAANRHLDVDDDMDEEEDDLFAELTSDYVDRVREVNRRLDEVDLEAAMLRKREVAFNITTYGERGNEDDEDYDYNIRYSRIPTAEQQRERKSRQKHVRQLKLNYRRQLLGWLQKTGEKMTVEEAENVQNVWRLGVRERWRLYRYWVDMRCRQLRGEIRDTARTFEDKARRYQEILQQEDKAILEKATVIGMTTTGAARYQAILREIGPRIVIVEEAAEVLEGHVITALSDQCQHVVLIGDHKQLRPNPAVHRLKLECGLDISLFERLVNNGFRFDRLRYQHRMRPEISQLLRVPNLYPDLQDHDKVKDYPHVRNVTTDVCLFQHEEQDQQEIDTSTFSNMYEARMLVGLCEYLLLQGYSPRQITILAPYKGQVQLIKDQLKSLTRSKAVADRMEKGGLKISSVDNYQGEENDIILLSLVRSNPDNDVGFLKTNNRLCVALSRAKIGLYVFGNLAGIAEKNDLMREVLRVAKSQGLFKYFLSLSCLRHQDEATIIRSPEDFKKVPDGGCKRPCQIRLNCGHACKRVCHSDDAEHTEGAIACDERCAKFCTDCKQNCKGGHACGKHTGCENLVQKTVPMCGHVQDIPCRLPAQEFECRHVCRETLPCGHICQAPCGTRHDHKRDGCDAMVEVEPTRCGHKPYNLPCKKVLNGDAELADRHCPSPCQEVLGCEHLCSGSCGQCSSGRLHATCRKACTKILICGHACQALCGSCPPCTLPCETVCNHSHCAKRCGEPCPPCLEQCDWRCTHASCLDLCCQPCVRPSCDEPCSKNLQCGHRCCGLCGEECPRLCSRCHVEQLKTDSLYGYDGDKATRFIQLDCGHVLETEFVDQWMVTDQAAGPNEETQGRTTIGLKRCPLCNTPIRKCLRYSNNIKTQLRLIEEVKKRYLGERRAQLEEQLKAQISQLGVAERRDMERLLHDGPNIASETVLEAQMHQVNLFQHIRALRRVTMELRSRFPDLCQIFQGNSEMSFRQIDRDLENFECWTTQVRSVFTEQNQTDSDLELARLRLLLHLLKSAGLLNIGVSSEGGGLSVEQKERVIEAVGQLSQLGRAEQEKIGLFEDLVKELSAIIPDHVIVLSAEEKRAIVQAVNVQHGAWYKCPNGHIYAIGDCGQANEESQCPDCKARIGGTNHRLVSGNAQAPEMDGADRPIWDNLAADRELAERLQRELNGL